MSQCCPYCKTIYRNFVNTALSSKYWGNVITNFNATTILYNKTSNANVSFGYIYSGLHILVGCLFWTLGKHWHKRICSNDYLCRYAHAFNIFLVSSSQYTLFLELIVQILVYRFNNFSIIAFMDRLDPYEI